MENDFEPNMYDTDDDFVIPLRNSVKVDVIKSTLTTEIAIDGKKFVCANPLYVEELHKIIVNLKNELTNSKHDIKQMQYKLRQYDNILRNFEVSLNGKVDRY